MYFNVFMCLTKQIRKIRSDALTILLIMNHSSQLVMFGISNQRL